MNDLTIPATQNSPAIAFNFLERRLQIQGNSYPENAAMFYAPVFEWVENCLAEVAEGQIRVIIKLNYFNSTTSRVLLDLFEMLSGSAKAGVRVTVEWCYHPDNDVAIEYGEEFKEEVGDLDFRLVVSSSVTPTSVTGEG